MDKNATYNALCGEGGSGGGLRQHLDALANLETGKTSNVCMRSTAKSLIDQTKNNIYSFYA